MASFPTPKVHRKNRRKLGRYQYPNIPGVGCTISTTGTTNLTMTFTRPVVVSGAIPTTVATRTLVSQTVVSPTVVTQVWSGNVTGLAYALPSDAANIRSSTGAGVAGVAGTFP